MLVRFVVEGGWLDCVGMVCATYMCGIGVMVLLRAPLFAHASANSLP